MNFTESINLLFKTLADTTLFVLSELVQHISAHPVSFFSTGFMVLIAYGIITGFKIRVAKNPLLHKYEVLVYIISPFIFILITYFAVKHHPDNPLLVLLNYAGFYWICAVLLKIPSRYFGMRIKFQYAPSLFLIVLSLLIALYLDVSTIYSDVSRNELQTTYEFARGISKLLIVMGFFIYIKGVLPQALHLLSEKYKNVNNMTGFTSLVLICYLAFSVLWMFNVFSLDFRAVMAASLLGVMAAVLSYIYYRIQGIIDYFYEREHYTELEWANIKKSSMRFIMMVFIYIYYLLIYSVLDMKQVLENLKSMYLFETKLFSLSLLSLISAVILFFLLKSMLYLFTKYLRIMFYDRELADDTDSLEVIVYNLGILMVIMITLLQIGITWQLVVPVAGALGIGIGFGLQSVINNYICGFILLFSKKVRIGDFVELPGTAGNVVGVKSSTVFGKVASIDMFATTVQTYDNIEIMVPNSVFISDTIINYTRSDKYIRVRVPVGIAYSSDIDQAMKLMFETASELEHVVKEKGNDVWFMEYGDSSLNFMVLFWLDMSEGFQITKVKNVFLTSLWHKFKEHGIEIPFPQQDVWFRNELSIADRNGKEKQ